MKKNYFKLTNWLPLIAIMSLGFASCNKDLEEKDVFTIPNYYVSGKVTDSENNPIEGVEVSSMTKGFGVQFQVITPQDITDKDGNFKIKVITDFPNGFYSMQFRPVDENSIFQVKYDSAKIEKNVTGGNQDAKEFKCHIILEKKKTE